MNTVKRDIIVIGASAGGFQAVSDLLLQFPSNIDAAIFLVVHLSDSNSAAGLLNYFKKQTLLECKLASNHEHINPGTVYIAPPEHHLLLHKNHTVLSKGAKENKYRPSIDHLFRSAAAYYGARVIGIILTGMMEDGTAGMASIKKSGGTLIIQDPAEAVFADMPLSVASNMQVDYVLPMAEMGKILIDLVAEEVPQITVPEEVLKEAEIAERVTLGVENTERLGTLAPIVCPECGGSLFTYEDAGVIRFKCHTGHSYTDSSLLRFKTTEVEDSMWVALRVLEEKRNLLKLMAAKSKDKSKAEGFEGRAEEAKVHIDRIRETLLNTEDNPAPYENNRNLNEKSSSNGKQ